MKPILRWVGGKTKLLPELVARMPEGYGRYFEPFAGGAALFLHLQPRDAFLSDANADLIAMYHALRVDPDGVIAELKMLERHHELMRDAVGGGAYAGLRNCWNDPHDGDRHPSFRAALFIYLNKTCFNGLWRVNAKGEFNVPQGDMPNPMICDEPALREAARALKDVSLSAMDYAKYTTAWVRSGDFVYFDPPYVPASPSASFTSYTADGFGAEQQRQLAELASYLVTRGVKVMLSNSDTPLVHQLYAGFRIDVVQRPGTVSSKGTARGKVNEVIITGGYER